jgi:hypothetical protein
VFSHEFSHEFSPEVVHKSLAVDWQITLVGLQSSQLAWKFELT